MWFRGIGTINELVYHHKVIFHCFFIYLAKVGLANVDKTVTVFEDEGGVSISPNIRLGNVLTQLWVNGLLRDRHNVEIINSNVKEACWA